jgi:mRNA interferase RelE/StbE
MDYYKILWKKSAERDIRNIDHARIPAIIKAVEKLRADPFPEGVCRLKGSERKYTEVKPADGCRQIFCKNGKL